MENLTTEIIRPQKMTILQLKEELGGKYGVFSFLKDNEGCFHWYNDCELGLHRPDNVSAQSKNIHYLIDLLAGMLAVNGGKYVAKYDQSYCILSPKQEKFVMGVASNIIKRYEREGLIYEKHITIPFRYKDSLFRVRINSYRPHKMTKGSRGFTLQIDASH